MILINPFSILFTDQDTTLPMHNLVVSFHMFPCAHGISCKTHVFFLTLVRVTHEQRVLSHSQIYTVKKKSYMEVRNGISSIGVVFIVYFSESKT